MHGLTLDRFALVHRHRLVSGSHLEFDSLGSSKSKCDSGSDFLGVHTRIDGRFDWQRSLRRRIYMHTTHDKDNETARKEPQGAKVTGELSRTKDGTSQKERT